MKVLIEFDDGSKKEVVNNSEANFSEFMQDMFKKRYYVISRQHEVGNALIDTSKVKIVELIEI
ncbi:hypothetical protein [Paenibacillus taichungensis]|uniref:hypothetical protein n=1 Tax=Paenibacillus taichungensis TaxID=484184 RepID=UPI0039A129C9